MKTGRPKSAPEDLRSERLRLRATPAEAAALRAAAAAAGMTLGRWMRERLMAAQEQR